MRTRLLLLPLLVLPALAACSVRESTGRESTSAYTVDENAPTSLDTTCSSLADTGDMYRYCMQYGPQQALAAEHN
jgi:hypothetical protein